MARCWLCNRKMVLKHDKNGYWLWCGKCAAVYMEGKVKHTKEDFLNCYERDHGKKKDGCQLTFDFS